MPISLSLSCVEQIYGVLVLSCIPSIVYTRLPFVFYLQSKESTLARATNVFLTQSFFKYLPVLYVFRLNKPKMPSSSLSNEGKSWLCYRKQEKKMLMWLFRINYGFKYTKKSLINYTTSTKSGLCHMALFDQ